MDDRRKITMCLKIVRSPMGKYKSDDIVQDFYVDNNNIIKHGSCQAQ